MNSRARLQTCQKIEFHKNLANPNGPKWMKKIRTLSNGGERIKTIDFFALLRLRWCVSSSPLGAQLRFHFHSTLSSLPSSSLIFRWLISGHRATRINEFTLISNRDFIERPKVSCQEFVVNLVGIIDLPDERGARVTLEKSHHSTVTFPRTHKSKLNVKHYAPMLISFRYV